MTGGHYDVDALIMDPNKNVIYKEVKKQYDSHTWKASTTGEYRVCFSNEFSTFSHKLVYMDFQVGDEEPLPGVGEHSTAMTQVKTLIFLYNKHSIGFLKIFFVIDAKLLFRCGKLKKY